MRATSGVNKSKHGNNPKIEAKSRSEERNMGKDAVKNQDKIQEPRMRRAETRNNTEAKKESGKNRESNGSCVNCLPVYTHI